MANNFDKAIGRAAPPPAELVDAAYQVIVQVLPDEDPRLFALLQPRVAVVGQAAEAQTLREVLEKFGTELPANANPLSRAQIDKFTIDWSNRYAHKAVAQVTDSTRRGIAQTVAEGIWREAGVAGTAKNIRVDLVADDLSGALGRNRGLDKSRVASVAKERARLEAAGVTGDELERKLDKFATAQLNDRAKVIAQDQMRQTTSSAQEAQAQRYGARRKRWAGPNDEKTRDECRANLGQGWIPINSTFASGDDITPQGPRCRHHTQYEGVDVQKVREVLAEL
jgi:hypothetical protein